MSQFAKEHRAYFDSDAGRELVDSLKTEIDAKHAKAETATDSDLSFAFTQRAKGVREALDIINSMIAGKKPIE